MVNPQPQATPSPEQHCPRKTQIARTSRQYKIKRDTKTGRLKGRVNQVVSLMVKGGIIELIGVWNEDGNDDGFDPYLKVSVREGGNFATKSGIFKLADRRGPPDGLYEYLPSPQERRKVTGEPFARHWYMRLVKPEPNEDCIEIRKKIVNSVAHFLKKLENGDRMKRQQDMRRNIELGKTASSGGSRSGTLLENHYVVPEHWDLTPETREPLDHYVTDKFVGQAIYSSMQLPGPGAYQSFATTYPTDAAYFFSGPPFSSTAINDFGYRDPEGPLWLSTVSKTVPTSSTDENGDTTGTNDHTPIATEETDYFGACSD